MRNKRGKKAEVEEVDDDLNLGGEQSDNDVVSGFGSDEEEGESSDAEDGEEEHEEGSEASDEAADDHNVQDAVHSAGTQDDVADGEGPRERSRTLARIAKDDHAGDVGAIKQRISDDATLLGNWRKAKELGERRSRAEVFEALVGNVSTYFGYSDELAEYFLKMFSPEDAVKFFEANEQSRPLTIRANSLKARRSTLMQSLATRKVNVDVIGEWTKVGLKVYDAAVPVGATPEYLGGQYMIQSASSLVPVMALAPQQNEVVLDMAAAPGGKTTYIGQLMRNTGTLFANDIRKDRCKSLTANIHRMGLTNVVVVNVDGRKLKEMLPKLDRVLLDAPCSGSGIIARDPSVKVKRGQKDFEETSKLQKELLAAAVDMVDANSKTGGYVVYSTCSVSVEENESVIDHILKVRNVELVSFESALNFGVEGFVKFRERRFHPTMNLCRRYYPHVHNMDGFFVAKLRKTSNKIPERIKKDRSKGADNIKNWGEEHWTKDMMDSVADYSVPGVAETVVSKSLNKVERKKLKRAQQLAARAAAFADKRVEPEEEPKPQTNGATSLAFESTSGALTKKAKAPKKKKAGTPNRSSNETPETTGKKSTVAAEAQSKRDKVLKRKKAAVVEETSTVPALAKKKRRKSA